jgi:NAD(P)-dependent dehydrogenase (short-subunit alcohol dehydrogenase family)
MARRGEIRGGAKGQVRVSALDLRDLQSVAAFYDSIVGPVDLLIANAGVSRLRSSTGELGGRRRLLPWSRNRRS